MWLDADDILTHPNREEFRKLKSIRNFQYDAVFMLYEATQNGMYTESFYRERIIRSERSLEFRDEIHEYIDLSSILSERILRSPIVITHTKDGTDSKRNLEILEKTIRRGKSSLRLRANYAAELHYAGRKEEALAEYERFFVEDGAKAPEAMRAGESLFRLYMEGGEPLKIKKLVDLLEERCIDRSEYCCMRGEYAEKVLHDAEQAEEWYRKALACEIQTNAFNSVSNRCYYYLPCYNLGQIYAKRGDLIKAKDFLQRALVEMKKYQVMKR